MAITKVTYDTGAQPAAGFQSQCDLSMGGLDAMNNYLDFNGGLIGGSAIPGAIVSFQVGMVKASATLTFVSAVATNSFTINGVTFTGVAAGAVGNQFNIGVSDTATAANAVTAINASASALVSGMGGVSATSALGVVTLSARSAGTTGNTITLVGGPNITASAARLSGGSDGTLTTIDLS